MNPLEDSDIGINLKGFMKILDMNIELFSKRRKFFHNVFSG